MSTEACAFALRNALNEMKNVCPDIANTFIFRETGEILAEDQTTTQIAMDNAQEAFRALTEKAQIIGEIESVSFRGENAKANITRFQDFYIANVTSNEADEKTVTNLTRIMIPTMLKLVQEIYPSSNRQQEPQQEREPEPEPVSFSPEPSLAVPEKSQLTVESFGFGDLLKDSSLAFIDCALISQWNEAYGDNKAATISVENPINGKNIICQFGPFKDSKYEGKGVIQLSEKTRSAIGVGKGAQIIVKPVLSGQEDEVASNNSDDSGKAAENSSTSNERYSSDAPTNQFMVENLSGIGSLLKNSEIARVDEGTIARWTELFGEKKIEHVTVEDTVTGKKVICKFKPMKGSDSEGKGVIQLPEKIQQALGTKKGALVVIKPVVER